MLTPCRLSKTCKNFLLIIIDIKMRESSNMRDMKSLYSKCHLTSNSPLFTTYISDAASPVSPSLIRISPAKTSLSYISATILFWVAGSKLLNKSEVASASCTYSRCQRFRAIALATGSWTKFVPKQSTNVGQIVIIYLDYGPILLISELGIGRQCRSPSFRLPCCLSDSRQASNELLSSGLIVRFRIGEAHAAQGMVCNKALSRTSASAARDPACSTTR